MIITFLYQRHVFRYSVLWKFFQYWITKWRSKLLSIKQNNLFCLILRYQVFILGLFINPILLGPVYFFRPSCLCSIYIYIYLFFLFKFKKFKIKWMLNRLGRIGLILYFNYFKRELICTLRVKSLCSFHYISLWF